MLSSDALSKSGENIEEDVSMVSEPPKIGKLRVMKSGKVVMRFQLPGQENFVDYELNKGIAGNFYQEIVSVDSQNRELHYLS